MATGRSRALYAAALTQTAWTLVASIVVGFGYLAALLLSGRAVGTFDVAAAAAAAAVTGALGTRVTASMRAAGETALADLAQRRPRPARPAAPTGTRAMLAVPRDHTGGPPSADPPDYTGQAAADVDQRRAVQAKIDRASRAPRHELDVDAYGRGARR